MTCSCEHIVTMYRKRNKIVRLVVSTSSGVLDITGAKIWFSVKRNRTDVDTSALITKKSANNDGSDAQAKVIDGAAGIFEVYLVPVDTQNITAGDYWWDAVIETSAGRRMQAVTPSQFHVEQPVTET